MKDYYFKTHASEKKKKHFIHSESEKRDTQEIFFFFTPSKCPNFPGGGGGGRKFILVFLGLFPDSNQKEKNGDQYLNRTQGGEKPSLWAFDKGEKMTNCKIEHNA